MCVCAASVHKLYVYDERGWRSASVHKLYVYDERVWGAQLVCINCMCMMNEAGEPS